MQESKYIKTKKSFLISDNKSLSLFCKIEIVLVAVLYVYACWYVQTYSDIGLVVKGSSILILVFLLLDIFFESKGVIDLELIPKGMIVNLCLSPYFLFVGYFVAYNFPALLNSLIIYTGYVIAGIAICYISSKKQSIDWFMIIMIFTALLCAVHALIAGDRYYGYGLRLSNHNNIHIFSFVLVLGIFALAYKSKNTITSLLIHIVPAFFLYYCIIESSSRKCFIAASLLIVLWLVTTSYYILKNRNDVLLQILIVFAAASLIVLVYTRLIAFLISSRTFARFKTFTDEESNRSRIVMYIRAIEIFLEKPLFGGGFDQFKFWSGIGGYSHATYAEAIADFGLVGSTVYFTPIIAVGWKLIRLSVFDSKTYHIRIVFALFVTELFLGVGQIIFIEPQQMFVFPIIYWCEMFESEKYNNRCLPVTY